MLIVGRVVKCGKTTPRHGLAASATLGLIMAASSGNAWAQNIGSEDRSGTAAIRPAMSVNETIPARHDDAANASDRPPDSTAVWLAPPSESAAAHTHHSVDSTAVTVEKVHAMAAEASAASVVKGVTLWDEIAPSLPAPIPVDAAALTPPAVRND
ncbi:hypothetical protein [Caballeronia sp.]|uniref:hypothetical protein n=1 Tax=Caballeronia sp. TaxID=1931223 RepID=UPI003C4C9C73